MAHFQISHLSTEYLYAPVSAREHGLPYDPTGSNVELAIVDVGAQPADNQWATGDWETAGPLYLARILIGPNGAITPTVGFHDLWVRITAAPELPVLRSGTLEIT